MNFPGLRRLSCLIFPSIPKSSDLFDLKALSPLTPFLFLLHFLRPGKHRCTQDVFHLLQSLVPLLGNSCLALCITALRSHPDSSLVKPYSFSLAYFLLNLTEARDPDATSCPPVVAFGVNLPFFPPSSLQIFYFICVLTFCLVRFPIPALSAGRL